MSAPWEWQEHANVVEPAQSVHSPALHVRNPAAGVVMFRKQATAIVILLIATMLAPAAGALEIVTVPLQDIVQIASGRAHVCALDQKGGVRCWGDGVMGQMGDLGDGQRLAAYEVGGLRSGTKAISAGEDQTCAISIHGAVKCWGGMDGILSVRRSVRTMGNLTSGARAIATGGFSCALLESSRVECRVALNNAPLETPQLPADIVAVAIGTAHGCALTASGDVLCWGDNSLAQTGNPDTQVLYSSAATPVKGLEPGVAALSAGRAHTCAVLIDGGIRCWGANASGQLGQDFPFKSAEPLIPAGVGNNVRSIAAGVEHSCAVLETGGVECWGNNVFAQSGGDTGDRRMLPAPVAGLSGPARSLALGARHSCALLLDATVQCWGTGSALGDNNIEVQPTPVPVDGLADGVTTIAVGGAHSCALRGKNAVCWGDNSLGQLGDGTNRGRWQFANVKNQPTGFLAVSAGFHHSCALATNGNAYCWGNSLHGQIGDGADGFRIEPARVVGITNASRIATGANHTCAIASGTAHCWGANDTFQVGDGTHIDRLLPTPVIDIPDGVVSLALGAQHSCALVQDAVWCWGRNDLGQLGDGSRAQRSQPVRVVGLPTGIVEISAGNSHTCALLRSGSLYCWGSDVLQTFGIHQDLVPRQYISQVGPARSLIAGGYRTCLVGPDGQVGCVGGESDNPQLLPFEGLATPVRELAIGSGHTCVVTIAGAVLCAGARGSGQLGDRPYGYQPLPRAVQSSTIRTENFTQTYWNPTQPGWGMNILHERDLVFATWYTYASDGKPMFLTIEARPSGERKFVGPVYRFEGIPFGQIQGQAITRILPVGTAELHFDADRGLSFDYSVDSDHKTSRLTPFIFGSEAPPCFFSASIRQNNYTALWWNERQPGWGLSVSHQGNSIFALWYTYDANRRDQWLSMILSLQADGSFAGPISRPLVGTPLFQIAGSATEFPVPQVGTARLNFVGVTDAFFSYSLEGISQTKSITRFTTVDFLEMRPHCVE